MKLFISHWDINMYFIKRPTIKNMLISQLYIKKKQIGEYISEIH